LLGPWDAEFAIVKKVPAALWATQPCPIFLEKQGNSKPSSDPGSIRIHKIIEAQITGIEQGKRPAPAKPPAKVPDLMEQIRLSLAQIEAKKPRTKEPKKQAQKSTPVKKKPQKVRA
jgi:hypothetical protein